MSMIKIGYSLSSEEQRPEELPVDLAEEMHVRGPDDPAVVYRRALATIGVDADAPPG